MATDGKGGVLLDSLKIAQLVDFQWRLGIMMSSDNCANLNTPYITLALTIKEANGELNKCCMEMSISEFQKFHQELKEISSTLATM
uniref:COMM domain-containing protein 6 n=1 Tax=Strigamia maritima TaxID=126957 RepID=T1JHH6_STRMM